MNYSIQVNNVSKAYFPKRERNEILKGWFLPFYKNNKEPIWALKDINFKVSQGESVGIIGMNGAGKSTLLKIITGTTSPTSGDISFNGRVVALLELGMGFHQEFSGRDNIMFAGQLIGLSSEEIKNLYSDIEDFAELGNFINEPVRTYSSGMQMRLAFSLATAVRPDILIVDEALSVGDAYFQQKSFAKIRKFKEEGTTLLFVSHDKSSILTLCDRAILLKNGKMVLDAEPSAVMDYYNAMIAEKSGGEISNETDENCKRKKTISGNKKVYFKDVFLENVNGEKIDCVKTGETVRLVADIYSTESKNDIVFGFLIKERTGMDVFGTNTFLTEQHIAIQCGESKRICADFSANIGPGIYSISVALHEGLTHIQNNYQWVDLAVTFTVVNVNKNEFVGVAYLEPSFTVSEA